MLNTMGQDFKNGDLISVNICLRMNISFVYIIVIIIIIIKSALVL